MKKSFLITAAAILSLGALVACGEKKADDKPSEGGESQGGDAGEVVVPVREGYTAFYFTLREDSAAIPEYASAFATGLFNAWGTAVEDAVEFAPVEGKANVYGGYFLTENWNAEDTEDAAQHLNYQLTLGYNAESGAPSTGVNWSFKSDECLAGSGDSGMDNLSYEVDANGQINLGTHGWESVPSEVVTAQNVSLSITLDNAVPEYVTLYMPGSWNSWACNPETDEMTPSADRKTWSINIGEQIVGTIQVKIIAEYVDAAWTWSNVILDDGAGENAVIMILRGMANTVTDISDEAGFVANFDFDAKLPDPSTLASVDAKIVLELTDTALTEEGATGIAIKGSFDGWASGHVMTVTSGEGEALVLEYTYTAVAEGNYEFGFFQCDDAGTQLNNNWFSGTNGSNVPVTIVSGTTTYTFAGSIAGGVAAQ